MNVLLIGSGGREHALAEALLRSPSLSSLSVAPGNAGTTDHNVELDVANHRTVVGWCVAHEIDLVVVGPEAPLVDGLADDLTDARIACFGPSEKAARLEGSKAFARAFAERVGIPSPVTESFDDTNEAIAWLESVDFDVVVKADGLAAGKGVIMPADRSEAIAAIRAMLDDGAMGDSGRTVVLEQWIKGEELSLFGLSDGTTVLALATAQDHKRVGDGDTGLNTGGMGAFSPVPGIGAHQQAELASIFLDRAVAGMAEEGNPYVGFLYAGLMLTPDGPMLIEYNCRFGDPEAQAVIPRIETDLLVLMHAAATGSLEGLEIEVDAGTAATVVICADGYPEDPVRGVPIPPIPDAEHVTVFHAGTRLAASGELASAGGRVMAITGMGDDLDVALTRAYGVVDQLTGDGLFARSDIGWRHSSARGTTPAPTSTSRGGST